MKKKKVIILLSVATVVVIGVALSLVLDWPINTDRSSGDIGKSVRYSQKVATEKLTNMEELLRTDTAYRQDIAEAYVMMHTRALQFDALVELSNEATSGIAEFADLLKEMNAMRTTVTNTCAQLEKAGEALETAFSGKECPDLEQNVINAALAYTTLQKQNRLADRFIETTDKYLKSHSNNQTIKQSKINKLKLVRDGWMDYQQMTAALEGDAKAAKRLEELGYQLTEEQTLALLKDNEVLRKGPIELGMRDPDFHNTGEVLGVRAPIFYNTDLMLGSRLIIMNNHNISLKALNDVIHATSQGNRVPSL